jgi:hypothetical protein
MKTKITPLQRRVLREALYFTDFETGAFKFLGSYIAERARVNPASVCNAFRRFVEHGIATKAPTKSIIQGHFNLGHPLVEDILETLPKSTQGKKTLAEAVADFAEIIPDYRTGTIRR